MLASKPSALEVCTNIYWTYLLLSHSLTFATINTLPKQPCTKIYLTDRLVVTRAASTTTTRTVTIYIYPYQPVVVFLCWYNNRYKILIPIIQCSSATPKNSIPPALKTSTLLRLVYTGFSKPPRKATAPAY